MTDCVRNRGGRAAWTMGLLVALVGGWALTGCSGSDGEQSCEAREDCSQGELCQDGVCVEAGEDVDCSTEEDCPTGFLCHSDGMCVEDTGETDCESTEDCSVGRICEEELCVVDPYGPFAEEVEISDEDYQISVFAEARVSQASAEVTVYESSTGEAVEVDTGDVDCDAASACIVTADKSHLLAIQNSAAESGQDVVAAPLSGDPLAVSGSAEVFAEGVTLPEFRGDGVIFRRDNGTDLEGYYQAYDGDEQLVAELHPSSGPGIQRTFDVDPESGRAVLFLPPDLERLDIYVGTIDDGVDMSSPVADLDPTENYPRDAGSLYIGSTPAGFSADGRLLAFATTGPNDHGNCEDDSECSATGHVCGDAGRCVAVEPTVNVVDMEFTDSIGEACLSHDECGPVHRCDSGSESFDGGTCQPQRIVAGLPDNPQQGNPRLSGCEATREAGDMSFTDIDGPLSFGADNRIYFVGRRRCVRSAGDSDTDVEANIPRTAIVAGDPKSGDIEEVFGNVDGQDYAAGECWDQASESVADPDACVLFIDSVHMSPDGQDLVYRASNPTVSSSLATDVFDVWRVRLDGENPYWLGQRSGSQEVTEVNVHRK